MGDITWEEVGKNFSELGRSLQATWEREQPETDVSSDVREAGQKVTDALSELATHINRTVASPEVRTAARSATDGLTTMLAETFRDIADSLERDTPAKPPG